MLSDTIPSLSHPHIQNPASSSEKPSLPLGVYTYRASSPSCTKRRRKSEDEEPTDLPIIKRAHTGDDRVPRTNAGVSKSTLTTLDDASSIDSSSRVVGAQAVKDTKQQTSADDLLASLYGYDLSDEGRSYEYGSDSDEESPPATPLSASQEDPSPTHDDSLVDISTEAFEAELESMMSQRSMEGCAGNGECDEDGEDEATDADDSLDFQPKRRWTAPGPSPLRQCHDAESLSSAPSLLDRVSISSANESDNHYRTRKELRVILLDCAYLQRVENSQIADIVASVTGAEGDATSPADVPDGASDAVLPLDSADIPVRCRAKDACGQDDWEEGETLYGDEGSADEESEEEKEEDKEVGERDEYGELIRIGRGTPPGPASISLRHGCLPPPRPTLEPHRSSYHYSIRDPQLPLRTFHQDAIYGNSSWATLYRNEGASSIDEEDDHAKRVVHKIIIGAGETMRFVDMRTDRRASDLLREHREIALNELVPGSRRTTGQILEEQNAMRFLLGGASSPEHERALSDSPSQEDEDDWLAAVFFDDLPEIIADES